jgi:hypothetical protein
LPDASSNLPKAGGPRQSFVSVLLRMGFTCALPVTSEAVVSYTAIPPLPQKWRYISVALSLEFPPPASCPMKPGLSSPAVFRHLQPRSPVLHIYLIYQAFFQKSSPFTNFNKRNIKCFLKDDRSIDGFYLQYYLNKCKERFKTSNS